jgi:virulence-associated protein VagC
MLSSKVFSSGNSQAIRLPKEYQVEDKELYIKKVGRTIILFPKTNTVSPVKTATNAVCVAVGRSRGGSHGWRTAARQGAIGSPTAVACSTDRRWMAYPP